MLKRFFVSFMGSMAAIWLSVGLFSILSVAFIAVIASQADSDSTPAKLEKGSVLNFTLKGVIEERRPSIKFMNIVQQQELPELSLEEIAEILKKATKDEKITGMVLDCQGSSAGPATRQSLGEALRAFREAGKWIVAYGDTYTQGDYYMASFADSIYVNPVGAIDVNGLTATNLYFTGLMEKLGVEMQILRVGTFKSAVEPFMLKEMSPANRMQQEAYLGAIWNSIKTQIAENRGVEPSEIDTWVNDMIVTLDPEEYVGRHVADSLVYRRGFLDIVARRCGKDDADDVNMLSLKQYSSLAANPLDEVAKKKKSDKTIALVYAVGDIVDEGDEGIVGADMTPMINELADDDDIAAMVLRVNSGGGSAFASEQIWEAIEYFKSKGKPVFASMGDYAASGGYYISSGADCIYAQPTTLTGSIGIFGMIPCVNNLLENKLGVNVQTVSTNPQTANISILTPMSTAQRAAMQKMINRGYETFVGRCAQGRHMSVDSIKAIAEGRVWAGVTAHEIGLVDRLGNLDQAIADMKARLGEDGCAVKIYPEVKREWWEELLDIQNSMQTAAVRRELGDAYSVYESLQKATKIAPVQCRMEYVTIE